MLGTQQVQLSYIIIIVQTHLNFQIFSVFRMKKKTRLYSSGGNIPQSCVARSWPKVTSYENKPGEHKEAFN